MGSQPGLVADPNNQSNTGGLTSTEHYQGTSLRDASSSLSGMAAVSTQAPNILPSPSATAGHTMGSKPGAKDPSSPGIRDTGVGSLG